MCFVSGSPLEIALRVGSRERLDRFVMRVFFYSASGAFSADGTFSSRDYGMILEKGLSAWQVRLESVPLKRGRYRIAFSLIDPQGDLMVWSYKQNEIVVKSAYSWAIADCQLRMASWRSEELADAEPVQPRDA